MGVMIAVGLGLVTPALAVITTADPLGSMAAGAAFLHEKIAAAPLDMAFEGLALAVTIGGIIALAQRAPQVAQTQDSPARKCPLPAGRITQPACTEPQFC